MTLEELRLASLVAARLRELRAQISMIEGGHGKVVASVRRNSGEEFPLQLDQDAILQLLVEGRERAIDALAKFGVTA